MLGELPLMSADGHIDFVLSNVYDVFIKKIKSPWVNCLNTLCAILQNGVLALVTILHNCVDSLSIFIAKSFISDTDFDSLFSKPWPHNWY